MGAGDGGGHGRVLVRGADRADGHGLRAAARAADLRHDAAARAGGERAGPPREPTAAENATIAEIFGALNSRLVP
ncbi:hypothetical protein, partial [Streptomyces roseoverticillatus]